MFSDIFRTYASLVSAFLCWVFFSRNMTNQQINLKREKTERLVRSNSIKHNYKEITCLKALWFFSSWRLRLLPHAFPERRQNARLTGRGGVFPAWHYPADQEEEPQSQQPKFSHQPLHAGPACTAGLRTPGWAALLSARYHHYVTLPCESLHWYKI